MNIVLKSAVRALRVVVAEQYVQRQYSRSLTPPEREWVADGWMPASLKVEVRER